MSRASNKVSGADARATRVLLVEINEDGTVGGSYQCLYDIARSLDRTRFQPVVLFYNENRFARQLSQEGISVHVWDEVRRRERAPIAGGSLARRVRLGLRTAAAVIRRARLLRRERIGLVHMNNSPCAGFDDWLLASKLVGRPCITHARGSWFAPRSAISRWLTLRFDRVIAISRHIADDMAANGVPRRRLRQVYDGIDTARWRCAVRRPADEVRESIGVGQRELLVLMVGHIKQWKGQHVAVEALERLEPQLLDTLRLVFAGEAPADEAEYEVRLRRRVEAGGLERRVTFLGARDDVPDLMNAADIVLHASTTPEPFGLVVVEAMALGKPVIAAGLGGPTEIVDRRSGMLFDPAAPEELARALAALADDPGLRAELGAAARARAAEFELASNVAGVEAVYSEVLGAPTVRPR